MDPEQLIGQLIGGFLGGKKKRRKGGLDLGSLAFGGSRSGRRRGAGGLVNAGTLLTVGGLIWGALETMQQGGQAGQPGQPGTAPPSGPAPTAGSAAPRTAMGAGFGQVPGGPPPLPPPLPGASPVTPPGLSMPAPPPTEVPPALLPLIQLAVSAARADGELSDEEVALIRQRAADLGAGGLVDAELAARRPLETITAQFTTSEQRQMAYALAYAVVHGEDAVSPGERMYLTQLSRLLALGHDDVERLERETLSGAADA